MKTQILVCHNYENLAKLIKNIEYYEVNFKSLWGFIEQINFYKIKNNL